MGRAYRRDAREIVFGEPLGFMTYRFGLCYEPGEAVDRLEAVTVARLNSGLGRMYFALVCLVHKRARPQTLRPVHAAARTTIPRVARLLGQSGFAECERGWTL